MLRINTDLSYPCESVTSVSSVFYPKNLTPGYTMAPSSYFATCARGLEKVLAGELTNLGATDITPGRGGVQFYGDLILLYQANLWLRTAVRVLRPVLETEVRSPEELYEAVRSVDWSRSMTADHTLAVDCNVRDSVITHSHYAALKTKDAICDQFVDQFGRRPSVDVDEPMIKLNLHIHANQAVLSLDSSGESLHKRGYRALLHKAALNEALAAGLILLSDWNPETAFTDPLCGSGTLPIEAAWLALRRPPGLTRRRFGFQGWLDFDVRVWTEVRDQARFQVGKELPAPVTGSDHRRDVIQLARQNSRAAGCGNLLQFDVRDLEQFQPPTGRPGVLLCNPPYGERLGEEKELRSLYRLLGQVLLERCPGWRAFVFSGNGRLVRQIGLEPAERVHLFNGRLPCQLVRYDL
jgi:putative N6-adenine-specific DNA methylase